MDDTRKILRAPVLDNASRELFSRFSFGYVSRINLATFKIDLRDVSVDFDLSQSIGVVDREKLILTLSSLALEAMPANVRRYMVVHQLAHFLYPNHGASFWQAVQEFEPNCHNLEKQLEICFRRNVTEGYLRDGEVVVDSQILGRRHRPRLLVGKPERISSTLELARHCQDLIKREPIGDIDRQEQLGTCFVTESSRVEIDDIKINTNNGVVGLPVAVGAV